MRAAIKTVAILIVALAVGLGVRAVLHHRSTPSTAPPGTGATTTGSAGSGTTAPVEIVPGPGQTFLTGTLTSLQADNAVGPPLTPPFTITIPTRGAGSADMTGVQAGGQNVEIYWYGGQPLPFRGTGTLVIGGGALTVNSGGTTWLLDGAPRALTTGSFFLGSPVAVGTAGLATPEQTESFDANDQSTISTTGNAQIHLPPSSLHITGPGSLTLNGDFQMQTPTATSHVSTVVFGPGDYDVTLTPVSGGDTIKATLQGPVTSAVP
jgi:hypothetical protein